ncbi:MAG: arylsulfatase, partial [Verrucomicrobiota bacterium]
MSDDMGFSDIGCYGSEIETPVLDGLAANGLRFTQFYNTGRCCPTRASLLTGLYPHQAGIGHMVDKWSRRVGEGYAGDLNRKSLTIAEALKPVGYRCYASGKWHVAADIGPEGPKHNWPLQRGFDRFYGTIIGAGSFFDPGTLTRGNTAISPFADPEYKPETFYYTDAINDHAVRFINEHDSDDPFFLYVMHTAAHWPMHALERDIEKYKGRYDQGYRPVHEARLKRLHEMGIIDPAWTPTRLTGHWDKVEHKAWEARCMEVYAAMVDSMDQGIGRIVDALKQKKRFDNTLIFFLQDNGGCAEGLGRRETMQRPDEPTLKPIPLDAVIQDVVPKQNRRGIPTLKGPNIMPGPEDTYIAYGRDWANVSNTPFREYKHWVHEGGIATPLIAHWPRGIARSLAGQLERQPGHLIDIMATCIDVAGASYPAEGVHPLEGVSLKPTFNQKSLDRKNPIYFEHEGNRALRDGPWKLVAKGAKGPWELYDMKADRTETTNLAGDHPERVEQLAKQWQDWAERAHVLPWPVDVVAT